MPRCTTAGCAYPLRPEGTLWGEPLPRAAVERAWELAAEADAFVVLDSDLRTAPISLLPSVPLTRGAPWWWWARPRPSTTATPASWCGRRAPAC